MKIKQEYFKMYNQTKWCIFLFFFDAARGATAKDGNGRSMVLAETQPAVDCNTSTVSMIHDGTNLLVYLDIYIYIYISIYIYI